ncbi:hypothetical protein TAMA11512_17970 [Selenomonas sp. TAMA-11512]|uniref:hypothetical protein n=1 Tax=Selenomonas sp. TAMA-11512 TaxID=3095337 RepID=UPI00308C65E8|nr:hypothetical protein TAMA11512_17970 [Selenomonas sp. TAMA-11512]
MDLVLAIIGFVVFVFISNLADKKKPKAKRIPPQDTRERGEPIPTELPVEIELPEDVWGKSEEPAKTSKKTDIIFTIPEIAGAPKNDRHSADTHVYQETDEAEEKRRALMEQAEQAAKKAERLRRERERLMQEKEAEQQSRMPRRPSMQRREKPPLPPEALKQAVIYAEILGKPKALQRRRRY